MRQLRVYVCLVTAGVLIGGAQAADAAGGTFKVAYLNIQSGKGEPPLPGHASSFADTTNCTDATRPLNAWGVNFIQPRLVAKIKNDPAVVAFGLGEAWLCGSPENVRKLLGWAAKSSTHNGVAIVAKYGFAGPEVWQQLDTSLTPSPTDTMWVVRTPVCLDVACTRSIDIFTAHWNGFGVTPAFEIQAQQTVDFMAPQRRGPHLLIGDLNVWEGTTKVCGSKPRNTVLPRLRDAGYVDTWTFLHGSAEGYTGIVNRAGCGVPEGYPYKRIDYAWAKHVTPVSMTRFGRVPPGEQAISDHYGIIAEYLLPGTTLVTDGTPPSVAINYPVENAVVARTTTIKLTATDNAAVARVDLFVDGRRASSTSAAPYQFAWDTTLATNGTHVLQAKAYDAAGNAAVSSRRTVSVQNGPRTEIVLYAGLAQVTAGTWTAVADASAAGGMRMRQQDAGAAKIALPAAAPAHYFEMTFKAEPGRPYHLWIRGKAKNNSSANDSVYVQFSGAANASGAPVYRIGTTSATTVNLEDCRGCGVAGWGWQDNGYGTNALGPAIYFNASALQTIRVQTREDGFSIDQIVISSDRYLTTAPGALKNDATIVPR